MKLPDQSNIRIHPLMWWRVAHSSKDQIKKKTLFMIRREVLDKVYNHVPNQIAVIRDGINETVETNIGSSQ